jgi:transposase
LPEGAKERLSGLLKTARSKAEYRRVLCVWLRAALGLSALRVAEAVGWHVSTVRQLQARYLKEGEAVLKVVGKGGRRNSYLSRSEEERFLERFLDRASRGGLLVVSEIREAFQAKVGHQVPPSTVYRLLARHGWRKLTPRRRHPQSDPAAQAAVKKNSRGRSRRSRAWRDARG